MAKNVKGNGKNKNRVDSKSTQKNKQKFNFNNEIVIGLNSSKTKKDEPPKKTTIKKVNKNNNKDSKNNKNEEKKINIKRILKLVLLVLIFVGIAIFMMTTPAFYIKNIQVEGNIHITKDRIESLSQISLNINTFKYSKKDIKNNIKEEPYIEEIQVKRKLPDTIILKVEERIPTYMILYAENYIYIDNQGYILEISNQPIEKPIIDGYKTQEDKLLPGNRLVEEDLEKINTVLKITDSFFNNEITCRISNIDISDKNNYIIKLNDVGKTVYLGDATNINDRILMLKEILVKEKDNTGEIFIKDINKVYFRQEN